MTVSRRGVLAGLAALFGRKALPVLPRIPVGEPRMALQPVWPDYTELVEITRKAFMPRLYVQAMTMTPLLSDIIALEQATESQLELDL